MVSLSQFLKLLTGIIDFFSSEDDNFTIMCDFNAHRLDNAMKDFIKVNGLINLIKGNTCLKGQLINRRFSFEHSNSYETGISDNHI